MNAVPLPGYDNKLVAAIEVLQRCYAEAGDDSLVAARLASAVASFNDAAMRNQIANEVKFDVNRVRREARFNLLYQRLVDDILSGLTESSRLPGTGYGIARVNDDLDRNGYLAIVHRRNVIGAEIGLYNPVGSFRWGIPSDRFRLVAYRESVLAAKQRYLATATAPGTHDGLS